MRLVEAAAAGARAALGTEGATLEVRHAFDTGPEDVKGAMGVLIATPANFGYMSGAVKDFFERIYHPCLEETLGMRYTMIVKGDTDVDGAAGSIERIAKGMSWRLALPALLVVGGIDDSHTEAAQELGATFAAGLEAGIF
jgi:multimeric flavodoxin WrbA